MGFRVIQAADGSKPEEKKGGFRIIQPAAKSGKAAGPVFDPVKDALRGLSTFTDSVGRSMDNLAAGKPTRWADNPALTAPAALLQAVTGQVTGPASRALATYGPRAYERPAAPWDPNFGQAPRALSGDAAAQAIEGDLNTALMGLRPAAGGVKPLPPRVERPAAVDVRVAKAVERANARDRLAGDLPQTAPGALPIHQGGENLTAMADVLANSPGPARRVIREGIDSYERRAFSRTKDDIARDLGGRGDFFETQDQLIAARKAAADEGMAAMADAPVSLDENAIMALRSDLAKTAIRERARNALASPDPEIRAQGAALNRLADEVLDNPAGAQLTLRDAQDISRTLQQQATAAYRAGDGGRGEALSTLGKAIRSNAADPARGGVEGYGKWLKQYGDDMAREEALQLGRDVFKPSSNSEQLRKALGDMSEAERALFQKGVGEALLDQVRSSKGDAGALRNLLKSEENMDRVSLAFPDDQAFANFYESAARRVAERDVNSRITGGSPTDPRQAARADLTDAGFDATDVLGAAIDPGGAARQGMREAIKKLPRRSRSIIDDPEANLIAARAMVDPDEMTRLLNTLNAARARDARLRAVLQRATPLLLEGGAASSEAQRARR